MLHPPAPFFSGAMGCLVVIACPTRYLLTETRSPRSGFPLLGVGLDGQFGRRCAIPKVAFLYLALSITRLRPKALQLFCSSSIEHCSCREAWQLLTATTASLGEFSQPSVFNCRKTNAKKTSPLESLSNGYAPSKVNDYQLAIMLDPRRQCVKLRKRWLDGRYTSTLSSLCCH